METITAQEHLGLNDCDYLSRRIITGEGGGGSPGVHPKTHTPKPTLAGGQDQALPRWVVLLTLKNQFLTACGLF